MSNSHVICLYQYTFSFSINRIGIYLRLFKLWTEILPQIALKKDDYNCVEADPLIGYI